MTDKSWSAPAGPWALIEEWIYLKRKEPEMHRRQTSPRDQAIRDVANAVREVRADVRTLIEGLRHLMEGQEILMNIGEANMATWDEVFAEIERDTTVSDGILAMLVKLEADVAAAGGDQAKIDQAFAGIKSNTDKLATKLVVNTPPPSGGGTFE